MNVAHALLRASANSAVHRTAAHGGTVGAKHSRVRLLLQALCTSEKYIERRRLQMQMLHSQYYFPTVAMSRPFAKDSTMYRLTDSFPYLVARVGVRMGELMSRRLEPHGLTLPMYRVLAALWQRDGQRLGDLSEMTTVEISTLSRLVGELQRRGLLSRTRPNSNGRTVEISLTRAGRVLVERLIPLAQRHEGISLVGFAPEEVAVLNKSLVKIYRNLDALDREIAEQMTTANKKSSAPRLSVADNAKKSGPIARRRQRY
jgi:DNA-binding MarR family transcriptional regulator